MSGAGYVLSFQAGLHSLGTESGQWRRAMGWSETCRRAAGAGRGLSLRAPKEEASNFLISYPDVR